MLEQFEISQYRQQRAMKELLQDHFDGMVLLDARNDRIINMDDTLTGYLRYYIDVESPSYTRNMYNMVDTRTPVADRDELKVALSIPVILEKLATEFSYFVDVEIDSIRDGYVKHKRLCFYNFDEDMGLYIVACEDTSSILENDVDPLTGIYDSTGFHKVVGEWLKANPGRKYRMQRYNIDHFRDINGLYGYARGNKVLRDFGQFMKTFDTKDSFSAHLGSDHFARFCSDDSRSVPDCAQDLIDIFADYDMKIPITAHMGVYDLCEPHQDSFTMSYKALLALQEIKGNSAKKISYYKVGMMAHEAQELTLLKSFDEALEEEQFEVWFQPQVNYKTGKLFGAEALVRWRHPDFGLVPPDSFIPLLERSGLITKLDEFVLNKMCSYVKVWKEKYPDVSMFYSGNLSRVDIQNNDFVNMIASLPSKFGLPLGSVRYEITESSYMDDEDKMRQVVDDLRSQGFIVEMDDFGAGYSSLNTLKDINVDVLKLDMKFLSDTENLEKEKVILSYVISMAKALGLKVIAEGVETEEQAEFILSYGCEIMQGYYFSKPIPADDFEKLIGKRTTGSVGECIECDKAQDCVLGKALNHVRKETGF